MSNYPSKIVVKNYRRSRIKIRIKQGAGKRIKSTAMIEIKHESAIIRDLEAQEYFDKFTYSQWKEYIVWINEAKTTDTRE